MKITPSQVRRSAGQRQAQYARWSSGHRVTKAEWVLMRQHGAGVSFSFYPGKPGTLVVYGFTLRSGTRLLCPEV
jgi:hypothetical protein